PQDWQRRVPPEKQRRRDQRANEAAVEVASTCDQRHRKEIRDREAAIEDRSQEEQRLRADQRTDDRPDPQRGHRVRIQARAACPTDHPREGAQVGGGKQETKRIDREVRRRDESWVHEGWSPSSHRSLLARNEVCLWGA